VQVAPANPLRPPGRSVGIPRQHAQQRPTHPRGKAALAATAENVGTDAIVLPGLAWRVAYAECVLEGLTPEEHGGIIRDESRALADARMEGQVAFATLLERFSAIRFAGGKKPDFAPGRALRSLEDFTVRFEAA